MHRIIITLAVAVTLASCGGGSDDAASGTDAPAATPSPATDPPLTAPAETTPRETTPPETTPPDTAAPDSAPGDQPPPAGAVAVSLVEWQVIAPTQLPAGPTTFFVTNDGDFRHHFGVARGTSYEELPQLPGGAIDEAALGDDYLGRTDNIEFESSATIEFDLTAGNYVLFCNIVAGPTSHAARGQVLSITVG